MPTPLDSIPTQSQKLPEDLAGRLHLARRALDALPAASSGRLPVWVAAACLGAGVLLSPGCRGNQKEADIPKPPAGLDTALKKPDAAVMEPELESQDPMDPIPGQMDPPPGSMQPLPPPTRGADPREDELRLSLTGAEVGPNQVMGLAGLGIGGTYGAPPMSAQFGGRPLKVVGPELKSIDGDLDPNEVRAVIRAHRNEVHHCYQKGLMQDPALEGELQVSFRIDGAGNAKDCKVERPLKLPVVGECVCTRLATWRFPSPTKAPVTVSASWTLSSPDPADTAPR